MFGDKKISQSLIDAVNRVLGEQPEKQKEEILNETAPVKEWYEKTGRVVEVDGVGEIPEVLDRIKAALKI